MARRVYTQRMQEVLEPVAQSISTLISRIEESEQDGVVLSDLTGPSAAVLAACKVSRPIIKSAKNFYSLDQTACCI